MGELFKKWMCRLGRCWNCRTLSTADGIGGQCVRCNKIHGWMTREELRAYADRESAARLSQRKQA